MWLRYAIIVYVIRSDNMYRKTYVRIDLDRFGDNVSNIVKTFDGYDYYIGVIKGNAYGHGEYVAKCMVERGINYLAVSSLEEAVRVRKYVDKGISILCLEPISLDYIDVVLDNNVTLCVGSVDYFKELKKLNVSGVKFHLKLNTGMNRLGVSSIGDVRYIFDEAIDDKNICLEGIFTHLATAGVYDSLYNSQVNRFKELTREIDLAKIKIVHVGRSCTLDFFPKLDFCNGVRVGIMMYGIESSFPVVRSFRDRIRELKYKYIRKKNNLPVPYSDSKVDVSQVLSLVSEVIDIQKVKKGDYVGYGSSCRLEEDGFIAVLPVGYADGLFTRYHNWKVLINGNKYRVIGSVNMGMITILVDDRVRKGDMVVVIDSNVDYKVVARDFGVTPYVLLTNLRRELPRMYVKNDKIVEIVDGD